MPQPGEIICYKNYQFDNGSTRDKLFVVLNAADSSAPCLVLKTTSKADRYLNVKGGCNPSKKVFFVPKASKECFDDDTYIQLPQVIEIPTSDFLQRALENVLYRIGELSPNCLAQLKNCLRGFKSDLAERHWNLIF